MLLRCLTIALWVVTKKMVVESRSWTPALSSNKGRYVYKSNCPIFSIDDRVASAPQDIPDIYHAVKPLDTSRAKTREKDLIRYSNSPAHWRSLWSSIKRDSRVWFLPFWWSGPVGCWFHFCLNYILWFESREPTEREENTRNPKGQNHNDFQSHPQNLEYSLGVSECLEL